MQEGLDYVLFFLSLIRCNASQTGKTRYGEKTPQHTIYSETLIRWYPNARIIHLIRDPRDVVASLIKMPWASDNVMINARDWVASIRAAERIADTHNYLRVFYEEMVSDPVHEIGRICEFIDEPYDPVMLEPSIVPTSPASKSMWWFQRAKQPLDQSRLEIWRDELKQDQVAIVEWVADRYMNQFGYQCVGMPPTLFGRVSAISSMYFYKIIRKILNWKRLWYYWVEPKKITKEEIFIDRIQV